MAVQNNRCDGAGVALQTEHQLTGICVKETDGVVARASNKDLVSSSQAGDLILVVSKCLLDLPGLEIPQLDSVVCAGMDMVQKGQTSRGKERKGRRGGISTCRAGGDDQLQNSKSGDGTLVVVELVQKLALLRVEEADGAVPSKNQDIRVYEIFKRKKKRTRKKKKKEEERQRGRKTRK